MTIKDIARESGYAVGTVSRVLNNHPDVSDKAREQIMAVVEKYNFRLNRNAKYLKQQAKRGIAIVVKGSGNMLFAAILEKIQGLVRKKGYVCQIYYIGEEENELEHAIQLCRERQPQGIFFLGSNRAHFQEYFAEITVPCVLVTNSAKNWGFENLSSVSTDDVMAAAAAVEHLLTLGHENIGILGGHVEYSQAASPRYQGCVRAFEARGYSFSPKRQYEPALFSMEEGYRAMGRLLDKMPELTAVFVMADVMAVGAIRAIRDRHLKVPENVSVIGFDGIELGRYLHPKLATIRQNGMHIASRSVEILHDMIENGSGATHEFVPFEVISGESAIQRSEACI